MIAANDPILEDIRYLSLESGTPFLSVTPPFPPAEIELFLNDLDLSLLSQPAIDSYYRIKNRLSPQARLSFSSRNFSVHFTPEATIEARIRFNTDIDREPLYPEIPSLLSFPLKIFITDILELYIEPGVAATPQYYNSAGTLGVNIPLEYQDFEVTQPFRVYMAAGGSWWNFQLGRDRLFWGTANTGSLSFSDNSAYQEFMRLSFFTPAFKYSLLVDQMPLEITPELYEITGGSNILTQTTQRYFYLHRLDFNFFNRVTLGLMEGVIVGNSPLELRYLNPLMLFHSFFSWNDYSTWPEPGYGVGNMNGSLLSVEVNWNITKSFSVYGQFVMNELSIGIEREGDPNQPPNGLGFLAGVQYSRSFGNWGSVFFVEFIYTDPYLYQNPSPFASFIQMQSFFIQYYPLGYPRDTIAFTLGARFFDQDNLSFSGKFSWLSRGEHDKDGITWDWQRSPAASNEKTPSGIAENKFALTLSADWKPISFLTVSGSLTGIYAANSNHEPGANAAGGQASISVNFRY